MEGAQLVPADEASLSLAVEYLRAGQPIIFPTDTVYGLGAHCAVQAGVMMLYSIKERPPGKPIPLLLSDPEGVSTVARQLPPVARELIARFFPGPLTLVVPKADSVPYWVTSGAESVAVRVPDHPFTRLLIRALGAPIATTSANLAGRPAPVTAGEARAQLGDRVKLILDGGPCPGGAESSVLDLTGPVPALLREGAVSRAELEAVCGAITGMVK